MSQLATKYIKIKATESLEEQLAEMGTILSQGGAVAFPTETVYGLGANALDPEAVAKIFQAKGRPQDNPLIVHISSREQLEGLVREVNLMAEKLMEAFWPGPLTIVLPKSQLVPKEVTAGLDTVAVRMPDHQVALALIEVAQVPVAAPSANTSGRPSPTEAAHVQQDLGGRVDALVDGGTAQVGLESTVVDVSSKVPTVLRPGSITVEMIAQVLGTEVQVDRALLEKEAAPRSPGMKYAHYSPRGQVTLLRGSEADKLVAKMGELVRAAQVDGKRAAVLCSSETAPKYRETLQQPYFLLELGSRYDLAQVSRRLYQCLRQCDQLGAELIYAESFERTGLGMAIMNRLDKAANYRVVES
ncbi:L-threonylcarbamoyladenylate synthase [Desulfitispora alkaliphila]|uniref:L-threonylcarbamoyladenylate synthase n=1 Tax=Desulfitispora alkaliphila TaxID=622674 RepID=UPI003D21D691